MNNKIINDASILEEMMIDSENNIDELHPGPYWINKVKFIYDWLKTNDLNNYKTFDYDKLGGSTFGAGSRWPSMIDTFIEMENLQKSFFHRLICKLKIKPYNHITNLFSALLSNINTELSNELTLYELLGVNDELLKISDSSIGNSSDAFLYKGKLLTPRLINKFNTYLFLKKHIDLLNIKKSIEIGPGAGVFAQILLKLNPHVKIYFVEIPPQLYVLQQSLDAVFPGQVATYREIKENPSIIDDDSRRIFIMAPWLFKKLNIGKVDFFMNEGFEEMKKESVSSYLNLVKRSCPEHIFLMTIRYKNKVSESTVFTKDEYDKSLNGYKLLVNEANPQPDFLINNNTSIVREDLAGNPTMRMIYKRT